MRLALEQVVSGYPMYEARQDEFASASDVPFRVADEPLRLTAQEHLEVERVCHELGGFVVAADELYHRDEEVAALLNRGKPDVYLQPRETAHIFLRPDLIITEDGIAVCEIETSPFGLGLAHALNQAYIGEGHETITSGELTAHAAEALPDTGIVVYSSKTHAYMGQLAYLADKVFSGDDGSWTLAGAAEDATNDADAIYRAFYLREYDTDPDVRAVVDNGESSRTAWTPSLTPHIEEKALMALIWDRRYQAYFRSQLGETGFDYLLGVIPPTWIVGEEVHFAPGLPNSVSSTADIASLSRSKRALVLKASGYDDRGSWSEGVHILGQVSAERARTLLNDAEANQKGLQIVQEFRRGKKITMSYEEDGEVVAQDVRVRLTPYMKPYDGSIIAAKATGRAGTDYIHASSDSINCAVGVR